MSHKHKFVPLKVIRDPKEYSVNTSLENMIANPRKNYVVSVCSCGAAKKKHLNWVEK